MKRRDFLKYTSSAGVGSVMLNSLPVQSFATPNMLPLLNCQGVDERILVVLYLDGGNDGLNTLVPINQYNTYKTLRPTIGLNDTGTGAFINLDTTLPLDEQVGINPNMTSFKAMYDAGKAQVIQAVGYPGFNGSHFKSTDLWLTGGDGTTGNFNISSGWMGRFLNNTFPGMYGNPNSVFQDPLGIQLGDKKPSIGFISDENVFIASNLTQQDPGGWYNLVQGIGSAPHLAPIASDFGDQLAYIMSIESSTNVYAQRITNVFNAGTNSSTVYPNTDLSDQLQTVARLISGGSKTKIFMVRIGGFDNHSGQVVSGTPHIGKHADLLSNTFDSVKAFHDDLSAMGLEDQVMSLVFTEFGRRITENGSLGTDHGNLGPMFLFGSSVEPGIKGTNIDLNPALLTSNGNLDSATQMQFDYRSVYKTILQDWLGASDTAIASTYFDNQSKIPSLINTNFVVDPSCYFDTYVDQTSLNVKLMLEGFYDATEQNMHKELASRNLVPTDQPYGMAPFNYTGVETTSALPPDTVDWVLVELRDPANINTVIARRAALLRTDGVVMEPSGRAGITFVDVVAGEYYVAIYHRNHIPVVSSVVHNTSDTQAVYDFTNAASMAMGTNQLKAMGNKYALYAGNFNGDGANNGLDYELWKPNSSVVNEYRSEDGDGNGIVNNLDYNLWKRNKTQTGESIFQ